MYMFSIVLFFSAAMTTLACSKDASKSAKSGISAELTSSDEPRATNHPPANIYWCDGGTVIGFSVTFPQSVETYQYFFDGVKLEQRGNKSVINPRNGNRLVFKLSPPNLEVFIADSIGTGLGVLNCIHHID